MNMKKIKNRLIAIGYAGFLIGSVITFKDVPPQPTTPITWLGVLMIIFVLLSLMAIGFTAGQENEKYKD